MGATRARAVTIGSVESYREARDDELSVMRAFNKHASHCDECEDPMHAHQRQRGLCKRGYGYVTDIGDYLYCSNGRPYSLIDKRYSSLRAQVEIPAHYTAVRQLFKALGEGFTGQPTRRPTTVIHHKSSQPREEPEAPTYVAIYPNYSNSNRRRQREKYYEDKRFRIEDRVPRSEIKRGSLYQKDEERRRSRYYDDAEVIFITRDPQRYRV